MSVESSGRLARYTIFMNRDFAETASLLSDAARASMLLALLDGRALPAGQLAMIAQVAPQTASSHLSKMVSGRLLAVEQQGRHRYYRLAGTEVASAIEALLAIAPRSRGDRAHERATQSAPDGDLAYARTCYSHLPGGWPPSWLRPSRNAACFRRARIEVTA